MSFDHDIVCSLESQFKNSIIELGFFFGQFNNKKKRLDFISFVFSWLSLLFIYIQGILYISQHRHIKNIYVTMVGLHPYYQRYLGQSCNNNMRKEKIAGSSLS